MIGLGVGRRIQRPGVRGSGMLRRGRLVGQEAPPPRVTTPRYQVCVGKEVMGPKVRVLGFVAATAVGEVAHNGV